MVLTAGMIDAESALRFGLVNQVVDRNAHGDRTNHGQQNLQKCPDRFGRHFRACSRDILEMGLKWKSNGLATVSRQDFKEGTGIPRKTQATISRIMSEIDIATAVVVPVVANTPHALPVWN